jgi:hypothetical protein
MPGHYYVSGDGKKVAGPKPLSEFDPVKLGAVEGLPRSYYRKMDRGSQLFPLGLQAFPFLESNFSYSRLG